LKNSYPFGKNVRKPRGDFLTHAVVYAANKTLQYELRPRDHNTIQLNKPKLLVN